MTRTALRSVRSTNKPAPTAPNWSSVRSTSKASSTSICCRTGACRCSRSIICQPGVAPGAGLFQFGLAIEDEAHAIARASTRTVFHAWRSSNPTSTGRTARPSRFAPNSCRLGGTVVTVGTIKDARAVTEVVGSALLVEASTQRMEALSKTIGSKPEFTARRRSDLDALVALTDPAQSTALNSAMAFHFAADVPIYATSQVSRQPRHANELGGSERLSHDGAAVAGLSQRDPR